MIIIFFNNANINKYTGVKYHISEVKRTDSLAFHNLKSLESRWNITTTGNI